MSQLAFGSLVGFCVTAALIWAIRGSPEQTDRRGYFGRIVLSAALTAVVGGLVRTAIDFGTTGAMSWAGTIFAVGWFIGALLAGWFVTPIMRRQ